MVVSRQKLLEATLRVFAEAGFRGATTRRIAEEAGVNEVTLFRHFRSKAVLIEEAAQLYGRRRMEVSLPEEPVEPLEELSVWCTRQLGFLRDTRTLIRRCMAELDEHPTLAGCMRHGPELSQVQLMTYVKRLVAQQDLSITPQEIADACMMLLSALFADAMSRDVMPDRFPRPLRRAGERYAHLFLRMLGAKVPRERKRGRKTAANGAARRRTSNHRST